MKKLALATALVGASVAAQADYVPFILTDSFVANQFQPVPGSLGGSPDSGSLQLDLDTFVLSGSVAISSVTNVTNFDYTADWSLSMITGALTVSNRSCTNNPGDVFGACTTFMLEQVYATTNDAGPGSTNFTVTSPEPGSAVANVYSFNFQAVGGPVSEVPVPAAAWLFGSALVGLAGIGRKRA
ncbi:VPLPA-CTERM sorting domain-containing protein [Oceanicoccus sp. KOV_DT_Chl]|uniref:VPLPA-CTERM sorting domain-containing protein n=1 Tax=Oceanicoccus sp. KOV_DT_Chl TaxID=1904639 RepID=UPI00190F067A|nr:VPLPA-CTERM sorting domain-containing protein [Oceanicoccus sp. KOV_DT_Chl]